MGNTNHSGSAKPQQWAALAIAVACVLVQPGPSAQILPMGRPFTLSGCVKPSNVAAADGATPVPPEPGATASPLPPGGIAGAHFRLTDVEMVTTGGEAEPGEPSGPGPGTTATAAAIAAQRAIATPSGALSGSLSLETDSLAINFGVYVNHRVEATGTVEAQGTSTGLSAPRTMSESGMQVFNVTSLRLVSTTCP